MEGAELPDNALGQSRSGVNFARGGGRGSSCVEADWGCNGLASPPLNSPGSPLHGKKKLEYFGGLNNNPKIVFLHIFFEKNGRKYTKIHISLGGGGGRTPLVQKIWHKALEKFWGLNNTPKIVLSHSFFKKNIPKI